MKKIPQLLLLSGIIAIVAFSGAGCTKKQKEESAYKRADKYFADGDYDKAETEYINVLRLDRFTTNAYTQLGKMALEQGRLSRAFGFLGHNLKTDSNNLDLRVKLGMCYLSAVDFKDARNEALFVLERRPEDPDAPLLLADSVLTLNDDEAAKQRLQKLTVPPAKRAAIEVALGNLSMRERDMKAAAAAFDRAKAADPKFGPLYVSLGDLYWSQKDLKKADEAFKFAAENAPTRSPRWMKYAQFKIQTGDVEAGRHILEEQSKKAPDCLSFIIALADIAASEKKYDDANKLVSKVLARDSDNFEGLLLSARLGMTQGDTKQAVAQFEKLAKAYPKAATIHYQLALAYNAAGDSAKAMASFNQALAINTNYVEADLGLAELNVAKGDFSSAIVTLKQLVQTHPKLLEPQLLLGDAYARQGDYENANLVYKRAEDIFSKLPPPLPAKFIDQLSQLLMFRGQVLLRLGKREDARQEFERALQFSPKYMNALEGLTDLMIMDGQYAKAMERVQGVMQLDTNAPEPSLLMARIYLAQKDTKQAVALLQKTIDTHPDFKAAYVSLGNLYSETGQPQKTLETAHQLLAKHPDDPAGLMLVATTLDSQKDVSGAEDAYEKVLKVAPKNSGALNNLAYLYAEHGQADKGLDLARRARELEPFDPSTADTLGWVLYRKGDYPQAAVLLQESAEKAPTVPDIQYHLGMTHYMLGEEDAARTALQAAILSDQTFAGRPEAVVAMSILAIDPKNASADARATLEKRVTDQPGDAVAQTRLGAVYKRDGATDKAIAAYEAALKANTKNLRALTDLAQLYSARPNQTQKAYTLAKEAYALAPNDSGLAWLLGRLAYQSGEYKLSLGWLQDVAKKRTPDAELLYDLALASYSMGQVADAVAEAHNALQAGAGFSRASEAKQFLDMTTLAGNPTQAMASAAQVDQILKTQPDYVPALMVSGIIAEQKPDTTAAKAIFEKVLAKYPDFVPAKRHLAVIYGQTPGDDKHSMEVAFKAYEAYPDDADVIKALGLINYRLGDYAKSARFLKESDAKKPGDAQLAFYLGMSQYQLKQKTDSKKSLQRAIDLKLPDPQAAEARKVLAELK